MEWIKTKDRVPEFGVSVLAYCRIYGRFIGSYERIDQNWNFGNWHDGEKSGILPPTHWMYLPQPPNNSVESEMNLDKIYHDSKGCGCEGFYEMFGVHRPGCIIQTEHETEQANQADCGGNAVKLSHGGCDKAEK